MIVLFLFIYNFFFFLISPSPLFFLTSKSRDFRKTRFKKPTGFYCSSKERNTKPKSHWIHDYVTCFQRPPHWYVMPGVSSMCSQFHAVKAPAWWAIPQPSCYFRHFELQKKISYKITTIPWATGHQNWLRTKCCKVQTVSICSKQGLSSTVRKQTSVRACPQTQRLVLVSSCLAEQV